MENIIEKKCSFLKSVFNFNELPNNNLKEIAFWGRSNTGKSSLLNSIIKDNVAKTSKKPGRTQCLNFFEVPNKIRLVDLPGYGYSKVSKSKIKNWNKLIIEYISKRENLTSIFLLIDSRHGLKTIDLEAINILESFGNHFFVVLTKIDKINKTQLNKCSKTTKNFLSTVTSAEDEVLVTSSKKKLGIKELKKRIINIIN